MNPMILPILLKIIDLALTGAGGMPKLRAIRAEVVVLKAPGEQVTEEQLAALEIAIDEKLAELHRLAEPGI